MALALRLPRTLPAVGDEFYIAGAVWVTSVDVQNLSRTRDLRRLQPSATLDGLLCFLVVPAYALVQLRLKWHDLHCSSEGSETSPRTLEALENVLVHRGRGVGSGCTNGGDGKGKLRNGEVLFVWWPKLRPVEMVQDCNGRSWLQNQCWRRRSVGQRRVEMRDRRDSRNRCTSAAISSVKKQKMWGCTAAEPAQQRQRAWRPAPTS